MAGQVNGTSGYEEAGGQGLVAGANAAATVLGREPLVPSRADGYIGVMIDDLVSLPLDEPYRMLTSRAEYRLILRSDTADSRLAGRAHAIGLIDDARAESVTEERAEIVNILQRLEGLWLGDNDRHAAALEAEGLAPARRSTSALGIAQRPGASLTAVIQALGRLGMWEGEMPPALVIERASVAITYHSFIQKEEREAQRFQRSGAEAIPPDTDFATIPGLRVEAQQRLATSRPLTIGQAMRTPGVTPSDIGALLVHLSRIRRQPATATAAG
jgi:tRNA uridine 5-carboxymethylaminomethyl modification enzyme